MLSSEDFYALCTWFWQTTSSGLYTRCWVSDQWNHRLQITFMTDWGKCLLLWLANPTLRINVVIFHYAVMKHHLSFPCGHIWRVNRHFNVISAYDPILGRFEGRVTWQYLWKGEFCYCVRVGYVIGLRLWNTVPKRHCVLAFGHVTWRHGNNMAVLWNVKSCFGVFFLKPVNFLTSVFILVTL